MDMRKNHYKDKMPSETIKKIRDILQSLGIEIEEMWVPESTVKTYSVRIMIKGTQIGTNGKGINRDYALASAYGEFMERLQNKALGLPTYNFKKNNGFYFVPDEKMMTAEEIVDDNTKFMDNLFIQLDIKNLNRNQKIEKIGELFPFDKNQKCLMYPFLNISGRTEYLPFFIIASFYGTNGMCAGNTKQEALVQGFSEIFERYVQRRVIKEKLALPTIPVEYIKKYDKVYKMYISISKIEGYTFCVKDASLESGFPVVAIVIIENNTGKYGVHFGAHPDFEIALERAFSEAAQGRDILEFAQSSKFDFYNQKVDTEANLYNLYDRAKGQYPYQFFAEKADFEFCEFEDVSAKSNTELLDNIIELILSKGYTIYIRDVSFLGVNSYHVIVPELSDLVIIEERSIRARNTLQYVENRLGKMSQMCEDDVRSVIAAVQYYCSYQTHMCLSSFYIRKDKFVYPFEKEGGDIIFFLAMCYASINDFKKTVKYLTLLQKPEKLKKEDALFINAAIEYFKGRSMEHEHLSIVKILTQFYDSRIIARLNVFSNIKDVLHLLYPDDPGETENDGLYRIVDTINKIEYESMIDQSTVLDIKRKE